MVMAPPLQHEPTSFAEAAKAVCHAAWNVSEVAWTLIDNAAAVASPPIKDALTNALTACHKELATLQHEAEQVAGRVRAATGIFIWNDNNFSKQLYDGGDYDTRHNRQPFQFEATHPFGINPPLPGQ
jgi:hypothetical protein